MNRTIFTLFAASAVILFHSSCVHAKSPLGDRLRERLAERKENTAPTKAEVELAYGKDPLQKLDYWRPEKAGSPLVVFVHGGGWKRGDKQHAIGLKSEHYLSEGYAFASLNYRLVPANTVEEQAQDVADALAFLMKQSRTLGFDKTKVVLMGHSAGAHLSALVGTDMTYLKKAGLNSKSLCGIIPLDGACYDVPKQIAQGGELMDDTYLQAFGSEEARQLSLSPTHHASAPNAPAFLILHVQRIDGAQQSRALCDALKKAGTKAEVQGFSGFGLKGHAEINRQLGDPDYPATPVVDKWLKGVFGK